VRIALFTDTLGDVNGVARFVRGVAAEALASGRELTVLTSTRTAVPIQANILNVPPTWAVPMPGYRQIELVWAPRGRLLEGAARLGPTIVHASTPGPVGMLGRGFARANGLPLVGTYHTDFPAYVEHLFGNEGLTGLAGAFVRWFYRPFDMVLTRSGDCANRAQGVGIPRQRLRALRPGIDLGAFDVGEVERGGAGFWGGYAGVRAGAVKCLYVGRVSVEKNLPLLARAWPGIVRGAAGRGIDAQLIVVGDGPYLPTMRRELAGTGVGASAVFLGFRHGVELARLYRGADLFLFPSCTDTLGQVVMEAQASGLPVVVTPVGGPREVIVQGRTGVVVPANAQAWVEAVLRLLGDADRRAEMSLAAREWMLQHTFEASFEDFWAAHREVCDRIAPATS